MSSLRCYSNFPLEETRGDRIMPCEITPRQACLLTKQASDECREAFNRCVVTVILTAFHTRRSALYTDTTGDNVLETASYVKKALANAAVIKVIKGED